jgi:hypothetical protein
VQVQKGSFKELPQLTRLGTRKIVSSAGEYSTHSKWLPEVVVQKEIKVRQIPYSMKLFSTLSNAALASKVIPMGGLVLAQMLIV